MIDWLRRLVYGKGIVVFEYFEIDGRRGFFTYTYFGEYNEERAKKAVKYILYRQEGIQLKYIRIALHKRLGRLW